MMLSWNMKRLTKLLPKKTIWFKNSLIKIKFSKSFKESIKKILKNIILPLLIRKPSKSWNFINSNEKKSSDMKEQSKKEIIR